MADEFAEIVDTAARRIAYNQTCSEMNNLGSVS
jgi:hypothetical protein